MWHLCPLPCDVGCSLWGDKKEGVKDGGLSQNNLRQPFEIFSRKDIQSGPIGAVLFKKGACSLFVTIFFNTANVILQILYSLVSG